MNRPPSDAGIPVLTEVLAELPATLPAAAPEFERNAADSQRQIPGAPWPRASAVLPIAPTPETPGQWHQHAQDIEEHVMQQLLGQVNSLLRQQIAEQMATAFEQITGQLTARIQQNLELALRQSVQLAVAQEIEKSKLLKNKGL